ncbi:NACHT domain-containing protein, partial [Pseudomonas savastanoi]
MSDIKGSANLSEKAFDYAIYMLNTLLNSGEDRGVLNWIITIVALLLLSAITLTMVLRAINKTIELLVKLLGAYKSSGLPMMLNVDNKLKIKRRKQFCNVMISDLGQLSRAENWNDQNFTDLEAEVEIEGGYFANPWDRLRRKKSYGLRKEPSLVRAITSSAERALQLIGEPGSGKSVALRHLAMEFAERGRKSNDGGSIVPLYINLREMEAASSSGISADDVRKFVLENIRRGDADTLSYVRENWNDYCSRGIWLFLFDSFDEIPAVLHSPAGSASVKQY